jgi:hypothetical protein
MKKLSLALVILAMGIATISASRADAAIGFDKAATTQNVNLTVVDTALTVTSTQSSLILLVGVYGEKSSALSVSSVVFGGSSLSQIVATTTATTNSSTWQFWYLINPPTGAGNVTTTFSALASVFEICAETYYGVNQTSPFDTTSTGSHGSGPATASTSVTTNVANDWSLDFIGDNAGAGVGNNPVVGTGQTAACNASTGGEHMGSSYKLIATPQTTSTYWTNATSTWGIVALSMQPAGAVVATPRPYFRLITMDW